MEKEIVPLHNIEKSRGNGWRITVNVSNQERSLQQGRDHLEEQEGQIRFSLKTSKTSPKFWNETNVYQNVGKRQHGEGKEQPAIQSAASNMAEAGLTWPPVEEWRGKMMKP